MNIKVDFDNIVVKEDKNDFNVKVLMLKGEKGDQGDGEPNVIEKVQVNGIDLPVTNKTVNVPVPVVDSSINSSSTNPVQNNTIYNALNNKVDTSALNNYYEISEVDGIIEGVNAIINKKTYYFDNVASMKAYNLKNGDYVITKGYYSANDGGEATYGITNVESQTDYQEELDNGLYATLVVNSYVIPEMFGAKGDGTNDDTTPIQNVIDYAYQNKLKVRLLAKDYKITDTLTLYNSISIEGINRGGNIANKEISRIIRTTDNEIFDINSLKNIFLSDISFYDSNDFTTPQVQLNACYMFNFTNLFFSSTARHINFKNRNFDTRLNNCFFGGSSNTSIYFENADNGRNSCNEINFNDCHWEHYSTTALYIGEYSHDIRFNNCKFESTYTNDINDNIITLYKCGNIYFSETSLNVNTIFNSVIYQNGTSNIFLNGQLTLTDTSNNIENPFFKCINSCNFEINIYITNININKYLSDYLMVFENSSTNFINNRIILNSNWTTGYFLNAGKKLSNITLNRDFTEIGTDDISNIYNRSGKTVLVDTGKSIVTNRITNPDTNVYGVNTLFTLNGTTKSPHTIYSDGRTEMLDIYLKPQEYSTTGMGHLKFHNASIGAMLVIGSVTGTNKQLRIGCSDTAPATGEYKKGDIIFNFTPASGEPIGWVCINSGTPGTWKSFGTIEP